MGKIIKYKKGDVIGSVKFIKEEKHVRYPYGGTARVATFMCRCGKEFTTTLSCVTRGMTQSCGCYGKEQVRKALTTHNCSKTTLYKTWASIKSRCYNKNSAPYMYYGNRGIVMSDEFKNDAKLFLDYIRSLPDYRKKGYTLDRIDNDGNYERGNLRWASILVQNANRNKPKMNSSGYAGVYLHRGRLEVYIKINSINNYIGAYATPEEAAIARDTYIIKNKLPHRLSGLSI